MNQYSIQVYTCIIMDHSKGLERRDVVHENARGARVSHTNTRRYFSLASQSHHASRLCIGWFIHVGLCFRVDQR